jgi:hypothetical protein
MFEDICDLIVLGFVVYFITLLPSIAKAQTVADPAYANMQRAVGGIIQQSTQSMGYVPSDPRTYSTLRAVGSTAAGAAAAAGTGILVSATAPAWATILAAAAVSGAVSYGVSVGIDALVKWAFGTGSSPITVTATSTSTAEWTNPNFSSLPLARYYLSTLHLNCLGTSIPFVDKWAYTNDAGYQAICRQMKATSGLTSDQYLVNAGFVNNPTNITTTATNQTLIQSIAALSAAQKQQAVSYEAMAMIVNHLWKQAAAQPGYAGVPYSVTSPVTVAQVQAWAQANPQAYPTVQALVSAVTDVSTGFAPSTSITTATPVSPATTTVAPTANNPSTQTQINLGSEPNILAPTLEGIPTAQMILAPLLNLLPDLKSYTVPGHAGACPKPAFEVFSKTIIMDQHCTIFEQQRAAIYAAGLLAFTLMAMFIILSA